MNRPSGVEFMAAVDKVLDMVSDANTTGDLKPLTELLDNTDPSTLHADYLVMYLSYTFPLRDKITSWRGFAVATYSVLKERGVDADHEMRGLLQG